jgi:tight adherence protein C
VRVDAQTLMLIGTAATFLAIAIGSIALAQVVADRRQVYRSLRTVRESEIPGADLRQRELATPFAQRLLLPALGAISRRIARFTPGGIVDRLDQELAHAGSPIGWDGARVLAVKVSTAVVVAIIGALALPASGISLVRAVIIVPFLAVVGYYVPEWILRSRSGRRQKEIRRALPDALDLMSITVQAGLGFDAAMERVAREMGGPLGQELYRVTQEMRLGTSRADALRQLADRTTVPELSSFVLALVQAETLGISVAQVLHIQAGELRVKRRQRAEEAATKLPVKLVFPVVLCIFPALMVVLMGPAAITIYENLIQN